MYSFISYLSKLGLTAHHKAENKTQSNFYEHAHTHARTHASGVIRLFGCLVRFLLFLKMRWRAKTLNCFLLKPDRSKLSISFLIVFHRLTISVVLQLDQGDYPENSRVVFCPNKYPSILTFMLLDFVVTLSLTIMKH